MSGPFQIIGMAVGFVFGGPLGASVGALAGGQVDAWLWPNKSSDKGPRISLVRPMTSTFGTPIPKLWGSTRLGGNVIWQKQIREVQEKVTTGGACLGGGDTAEFITYKYYATFFVALCEGPIERVPMIWADGVLIWDVVNPSSRDEDQGDRGIRPHGNKGVTKMAGLKFKIIKGTEDQPLEPLMVSPYGDAILPNTLMPAHRGIAGILFEDLPLDRFGNRIPNITALVAKDVTDYVGWEGLPQIESSLWGSDNIVTHPDGIYITFCAGGYWNKLNTLTNEIALKVYDNDAPDASDFDIDENNVIHTTKDSDEGNYSYLCRLDGDTFVEMASGSVKLWSPYRIRVFRTSVHPYVVVIAAGGGRLYITHRYNYYLGTSSEISLTPPSGLDWWSVSLDEENGVVWALAKDWGGVGTDTKVVKVTPQLDGSCLQTVYNISSTIRLGNEILFDPDTNQIVVGSSAQNRLAFFDADDMSLLATMSSGDLISPWSKSAWRRGAVDGILYYECNNKICALNLTTYSIETWILDAPGPGSQWGGSIYDPITHSVIMGCYGAGFAFAKVYIERTYPDRVTLSSIVTDICESCGIGSSEIEVSELVDQVRGFASNGGTGKDLLRPLMEAYFFDAVESDGLLKFVKRGQPDSFAIPEADLAAYISDAERPQELVTTRQQPTELPQEVRVIHIDPFFAWSQGCQSHRRIVTESLSISEIVLPVCLDPDEAKQIAVTHLLYAWAQRNRHSFRVPKKYFFIEPSDVGTITEGGVTHRVRVEKMEYRDGVLTMEAVDDDPSLYTSDALGAMEDVVEDYVDYPGPTKLVLLDLPLLKSTTNVPGLYMAAMGYLDSWRGATVFKSNDAGATWSQWAMTNRTAIIGKATEALADVDDPGLWDEGNSLNVRLLNDDHQLDSATELEVLNGANAGAVGNEIIQWRTSALEPDGSYTLSGLLRGRKGTEWATAGHTSGESFVVLDDTALSFVPVPVEEKNLSRQFAVVSVGMPWSSALAQELTARIRNMMPLSICHVAGELDGGGDLTISWKRKTRIGGEWADGGDVPLGETSESYEIDIYDGSEVVRTIASSTQTAVYSAAQRAADGLSPGALVDVEGFQVSSVIGRGFGFSATV